MLIASNPTSYPTALVCHCNLVCWFTFNSRKFSLQFVLCRSRCPSVQEMERDQHGRRVLIQKNMTVAKITKTFLMPYQVLFSSRCSVWITVKIKDRYFPSDVMIKRPLVDSNTTHNDRKTMKFLRIRMLTINCLSYFKRNEYIPIIFRINFSRVLRYSIVLILEIYHLRQFHWPNIL